MLRLRRILQIGTRKQAVAVTEQVSSKYFLLDRKAEREERSLL